MLFLKKKKIAKEWFAQYFVQNSFPEKAVLPTSNYKQLQAITSKYTNKKKDEHRPKVAKFLGYI